MFLEERRKHILKYLNDHERGFVNYFAAYFSVSKETIRSDLNILAEMGLVQRCYGGAIISRHNLKAELISETGDSFGVLLQPINHRKPTASGQQKGKSMNGKVCVFGSFNVDIVARVERFRAAGNRYWRSPAALGPVARGRIRRRRPVKPARRSILSLRWARISLATWRPIISLVQKYTPIRFINLRANLPAMPLFMFRRKMAKI